MGLARSLCALPDAPTLLQIGALVEDSLLRRHTRSDVNSLIYDALEEAIGPDAKRMFDEFGSKLGKFSAHDAGLTAIGSLTVASAKLFNSLKDEGELHVEEIFAKIGTEASTYGVELYLADTRKKFQLVADFIESVSVSRWQARSSHVHKDIEQSKPTYG